jgi:hypothetical protein
MEVFMPLHLDPLDQSPALKELLSEVIWPIGGTILTLEVYFTAEGHKSGTSVWCCVVNYALKLTIN